MVFTSLPSPFGFLKALSIIKGLCPSFIHSLAEYLFISHSGPCTVLSTRDALLNKINKVVSPHGATIPPWSLHQPLFPLKYCTPTFTGWSTDLNSHACTLACGGPWFHKLDLQSLIKCQALQSAGPVKSPLMGPWLELRLKLSRPPLPRLWNGENKTTKPAELDSCKTLSRVCGTLKHTLGVSSYLVLRMKHSTNASSPEIFLELLKSALISIPEGRLQVVYGHYCDFSL